MPPSELCEVVITAPDPEWLRMFSRQLVEDRLCASAHNFQPIQSIYRWHGEIHERREGRVSLHTSRARVPEIVARAKRKHPYEVPGVSTRPIDGGNPDYLAWISEATMPEEQSVPKRPERRQLAPRQAKGSAQVPSTDTEVPIQAEPPVQGDPDGGPPRKATGRYGPPRRDL